MAKFRIIFVILALISVGFLVFAPFFNILDLHLKDVIEEFFDNPGSIKSFSVMLPIAMLLGTFALLVTAITGRKNSFIGAALFSIVLFVGVIVAQFFINKFDNFGDYIELIFDFFTYNIWIQVGIYVLSLILGIVSPEKQTVPVYPNGYRQPPQFNPNQGQMFNNGQPYFDPNMQQAPYQQGQGAYQQSDPQQAPFQGDAMQQSGDQNINENGTSSVVCPNCGAAHPNGTSFCTNCGSKL